MASVADLKHELNDLLDVQRRYQSERAELSSVIMSADNVEDAEGAILRVQALDAVLANLNTRIVAKRDAIAEGAKAEAAAKLASLRKQQSELLRAACEALTAAAGPLGEAEKLTPDIVQEFYLANNRPMTPTQLHAHISQLRGIHAELQRLTS